MSQYHQIYRDDDAHARRRRQLHGLWRACDAAAIILTVTSVVLVTLSYVIITTTERAREESITIAPLSPTSAPPPTTGAPTAFPECFTQQGADIDGTPFDSVSFQLGAAITDDGNRLVVGFGGRDSNGLFDNGQVRTFRWNGTDYEDLMVDLNGPANFVVFGHTVWMTSNGSSLAVAAPQLYGSSSAYVFDWNSTHWVQRGGAIGIYPGICGRNSIHLDDTGTIMAISCASSNRVAYSAQWNGTTWNPRGSVLSNAQSIYMTPDGQFLMTAGQDTIDPTTNSRVVVYQWNGTDWDVRWTLTSQSGVSIAAFCSISADAEVITYRVYYTPSLVNTSLVAARWNGTSYVQQGGILMGNTSNTQFGADHALSDSGNRIAIGANYDSNAGLRAGTTRVYQWSGTEWVQIGMNLDGEAANDFSGSEIAISAEAEYVVTTAPGNDDGGVNAGHVRVYRLNQVCPMV